MGVVSGIVTYPDGSKARGVRVSGSVHFGGMTQTVYTDQDGRFVLEWSGDNSLAAIYVEGNVAQREVRNGSQVHLVKR